LREPHFEHFKGDARTFALLISLQSAQLTGQREMSPWSLIRAPTMNDALYPHAEHFRFDDLPMTASLI
jgi:hypothetical protein